jgi:hypothetical protein
MASNIPKLPRPLRESVLAPLLFLRRRRGIVHPIDLFARHFRGLRDRSLTSFPQRPIRREPDLD